MAGIPIRYVVPWPQDWLGPLPDAGIVDQLLVSGLDLATTPFGYRASGRLHVVGGVRLVSIDGFVGILIGVAEDGVAVRLTLGDDTAAMSLRLAADDIDVALEVDADILRPLLPGTDDPDPAATHLLVPVGRLGFEIDTRGQFVLKAAPVIALPRCMLGSSGIIVEASGLFVRLSAEQALPAAAAGLALGDDWRGVYVGQATVALPDGLAEILPDDLTFANCAIGPRGFSGEIDVEWAPAFSVDLFGIELALARIEAAILENRLTALDLRGALTIPALKADDGTPAMMSFFVESGASGHRVRAESLPPLKLGGVELDLDRLAVGFDASTLKDVDIGGTLRIPGMRDATGQDAQIGFDVDYRAGVYTLGASSFPPLDLGPFGFRLDDLDLSFDAAGLRNSQIEGLLTIPGLDAAGGGPAQIGVRISVGAEDFAVAASALPPLKLGVIAIQLDRLALQFGKARPFAADIGGVLKIPEAKDASGRPMEIEIDLEVDSARTRISAAAVPAFEIAGATVQLDTFRIAFDRNGVIAAETQIGGTARFAAFKDAAGNPLAISVTIDLTDGFGIDAVVPGGSLQVLEIAEVIRITLARLRLGSGAQGIRFGIAGRIDNLISVPMAEKLLPATVTLNDLDFRAPRDLAVDVDLAWSGGITTASDGRGHFEISVPIGRVSDMLSLESVRISFRDATTAHEFAVVFRGVTLELGPITGVMEGVGLKATIAPRADDGNLGPLQIDLGVTPPNGIGLVLDAGPVKGGGYLFFDADEAMYAGAVQLSMKALSFSAVGVVTTRLPDGGDGFSMLVVITAEFPPIQLGFGFSLIGIGGLAGIHRDMDADALAQCLREGRLGSILFPRDVVANVRRIVDDIRTVFPPRRDRHVFGPMVKIGWGANALLEMDVAVLLSLPSPIVIAILGRMRAALPTKDEAVIDLRLEVLGLIDLGRSRLTIEARLVDSRIAAFAVSGGMAMQLSWGATKTFALSVGGFNRRFLPPPDFHAPPRLAIALSAGENPTFTLSSYFALTSNAVQFGAAADFSMRAETFLGVFTLAAYAQFDVLLVFDPPFFAADLIAGIEVKRNGATLFLARLEASLTGPEPWRINGLVEVQIIVPLRIPFDHTLGPAETPTPAAGIALADLRRQLTDEIARAENWAALPAGPGEAVASMRRVEPMPGAALVHPLGGIGFRQRLLPLEKTLRRYGTADVSDPGAFAIDALVLGGSAVGRRDLFDDFAPGEFEPLSDDEKLSRPAFETFAAGIEAASMGVGLPSTLAATSGANFEETVINPDRTATDRLSTQLGLGLLRADSRPFGDVGSAAISVRPERYVLAERDTLQTAAGGEAAHAQCEDARRRGDAGARVTVPAHEAIVVFEP